LHVAKGFHLNIDRLTEGLTVNQRRVLSARFPEDRISRDTNAACVAALRRIGLVEEGERNALTPLGVEVRARLWAAEEGQDYATGAADGSGDGQAERRSTPLPADDGGEA
jgi:hypothetical protein